MVGVLGQSLGTNPVDEIWGQTLGMNSGGKLWVHTLGMNSGKELWRLILEINLVDSYNSIFPSALSFFSLVCYVEIFFQDFGLKIIDRDARD